MKSPPVSSTVITDTIRIADSFHIFSDRLLITVTGSYVSGISLHRLFGCFDFFVACVIAPLSALCLVLFCRKSPNLSLFTLLCIFFLFGSAYADRSAVPALEPDHLVFQIDPPQDIVLVGTLSKKVSRSNDISKALIDVSYIRTAENGPLKTAGGRVLLNVKGAWPEQIKPGDSLIARTLLKQPATINTPGTFDYRGYLARENIYLVGSVNSPVLIADTPSLITSFSILILYRVERLRTDISSYIDSHLPGQAGAIYKALLIGDRTDISPESLEVFKRSGILHLLAVSGMHTGLIAGLCYLILHWLLRRSEYLILHLNVKKTALLITLPAIFFYSLLTGSKPPVIRSLIMFTVFISAFSFDRMQNPLTVLASAAFLILLYDPIALFSPSFQLSFAAVGAILIIFPPLLQYSDNIRSSLRKPSLLRRLIWGFITIGIVTIAATIGTIPLLLQHFNRISLVSLPANMLIQPIICFWSLPIGMVALFCAFVSPELGGFLLKIGAMGVNGSLEIGFFLSKSNSTQLWLPDPSILLCMLYYLGLFILFAWNPKRLSIAASVPMMGMALFFMFSPILNLPRQKNDAAVVSILDIGHGSANVIEMSNGKTVLIDGGSKSAPGYDCGERVIAPFLWHRKIGRIDDIIITHDDADHYNGLSTIVERFRPKRLIMPSVEDPKKGLSLVLKAAMQNDVEVVIQEHDTIIFYGNEYLNLLSAAASNEENISSVSARESEDDRGLVIKFVSGGASALFPGDITAAKEKELVNRYRHVASNVLLSPHHGSSSSNSLIFLEAVNPDYLVFSANDHGRNLFPSPSALKHAALLDVDTRVTSKDGTVLITFGRDIPYQIDTFNRSGQIFYRRG